MNPDKLFTHSLDESLHDALTPGALTIGAFYGVSGAFRWAGGDPGSEIYGPFQLATCVLMVGVAAFCRGRRFSIQTARVIGALDLFVIFLNTALLLMFQREAHHIFGFYIVAAIVGVFPFPRVWHGGILLGVSSAWALAVYRSPSPLVDWVEPGAAMLSMVSAGVIVNIWRTHFGGRLDLLRAEAEATREARARVEARFREMTEGASDMICEIDGTGRILYANPAHETILGYKPEEIIGLHGTELLFEANEVRDGSGPDAAPGSDSDTAWTLPHQRIVIGRHKDGGRRTLECNIRPFELPSGELRLVLTTRDITERAASQRALEENREELAALVEERTAALESSLRELQRSQRLASMGTLAAGIAHQINNPIGSVQMSAELALRCEGESDEREVWRDALRNNVDQARRCGRIVSNMLQFSRNEPTEKSEEDLAAIVRRVCGQIQDYAKSQDATIDTQGVEGPLPIRGSAIELEQALLNIVRNATESSSGAVEIVIRADRDAESAWVSIADDGGGMGSDEADRALDPFFTTRLQRGGTGLGLSVAHGVVTDHGGTLSIESAPGVGTVVTLKLPLLEPAADTREAREARNDPD